MRAARRPVRLLPLALVPALALAAVVSLAAAEVAPPAPARTTAGRPEADAVRPAAAATPASCTFPAAAPGLPPADARSAPAGAPSGPSLTDRMENDPVDALADLDRRLRDGRLDEALRDKAGSALRAFIPTAGRLARLEAIRLLLEIEELDALPYLADLLVADLPPEVHRVAAEALAAGGDAEMASRLAALAGGRGGAVAAPIRVEAAWATVEIARGPRGDGAGPRTGAALADAVAALAALGTAPLPSRSYDRLCRALARGETDAARQALASLATAHPSERRRLLAACLLAEADPAAGAGPLALLAAGASDRDVRVVATLTLARSRP